ncbi:MAG: Rnase Y domain-containing protein, partial [Peptococcia bacterium]
MKTIIIYLVIGIIIGLIIGGGVGYIIRKKIAEAKIASAEEAAAKIIEDSKR